MLLRSITVLLLLGALGFGAVLYLVPDLRWRVEAVVLHVTGQIDDVSLGELLGMLKPGSGYWISSIVDTHNPYDSVVNPLTGEGPVLAGKALFEGRCVTCHGAAGVGGTGPALTSHLLRHGDSDWAIFRSIRYGVEGTAMQAQAFGDEEIWSLIAYVRALQSEKIANDVQDALSVEPVTAERLMATRAESENWLTYSGAYDGRRYSLLDEINRDNAHRLGVAWIRQLGTRQPIVETTPVVVDGVMYATAPPNIVHALDAATGEVLWTYTHQVPDDPRVCCGLINRGVAISGTTLLLATLDAQLLALDARTGKRLWITRVADYKGGYSFTSPPLILGDLAILGPSGADLGVRGFLDAYRVSDGERVWRTYTVPGPGEPGNESWSGDSWKRGGGTAWMPGVYDPELDLLYWPTGNPGPDYQGELREGDNLYTDSLLALDPATGEIRWHFQFTPHDEHDWASTQVPSLVDIEVDGVQRKAVIQANRNGFFYALDRETGEFLHAKAYVHQNWATSIDDTGRPILNEETVLDRYGKVTWPSPIGGTSWWSQTYSPKTGLHYVSALEYGQVVFKDAKRVEYVPGEYYLGGGHRPIPGAQTLHFATRAIDPGTGETVWSRDYPNRPDWWKTGGLVGTAGDILFTGDGTYFYVLDAADGRELWKMNVGGRINASPITYAVDGRQYFFLAAGQAFIALALPQAAQATVAASAR